MSRLVVFSIRFFLIAAVSLTTVSCNDKFSSEEQFQQTLSGIELAMESRDIGEFMEFIDESYKDKQSRSWKDIRRIVQLHVLRNKKLHIFRHVSQMNIIEDESAEIVIFVAVAGQPIDSVESLANIRAELMKFRVEFVYEDDWKVISAEWGRADLSSFL